jgi:hypothetical protein
MDRFLREMFGGRSLDGRVLARIDVTLRSVWYDRGKLRELDPKVIRTVDLSQGKRGFSRAIGEAPVPFEPAGDSPAKA